jgi:hypothetical protein
MNAIQVLLEGAIDYAGLFPPAQLGMSEAAHNFAEYRAGPNAWALGRFVVPANRLDELAATVADLPHELRADPLALSVLIGPHLADDMSAVRALEGSVLRPEAIEIRAQSSEEIVAIASEVRAGYEVYVEIPLDGDVPGLVRQIAAAGLRAKMRTGGVTADAFPLAEQIARFIAACVAADIPFKATAGLHHARRGAYRLTYETRAAEAPMFGYLNVLGAAALLSEGGTEAEAAQLLLEESPRSLRVEKNGIGWRDRWIGVDALASMRRDGMIAFGSCSFIEPLEYVAELIAQ